LLERVRVEDTAAEGKALARVGGKVVFVPFAVPGDLVDIQVTKTRKSYMEGFVKQFHEYSPIREEPFCSHFGFCGGCQWQMLPYAEQLRYKQQQVVDQLTRIGKVQLPEVNPIIGSENTRYYRNKLEFTFSNRRWITEQELKSGQVIGPQPVLGFHVPGKFDKVFEVKQCFLQPNPSDAIRLETARYAIEKGYPFYDLRSQQEFLRNLTIRTSLSGEVMVILSVGYADMHGIGDILDHLKKKFPQITSLMYVVNPKPNDALGDLEVVCYGGNGYITEEMEGLKFRVGPKSFYQTNSLQAYQLYKVVREYAALTGSELVYDLYTGIGTIAGFIAGSCSRVVGIDYVAEAIEDANGNTQINGIDNVNFFTGDVKELLSDDFLSRHGKPDVIILDPPRAGVHPKVINALKDANPCRIVYVSCNPATQARDINLLSTHFELTRIQPVDMFPHTHHVENVVLMERK